MCVFLAANTHDVFCPFPSERLKPLDDIGIPNSHSPHGRAEADKLLPQASLRVR
jgi:hypothetical protein